MPRVMVSMLRVVNCSKLFAMFTSVMFAGLQRRPWSDLEKEKECYQDHSQMPVQHRHFDQIWGHSKIGS